jgi:hypothetical protein
MRFLVCLIALGSALPARPAAAGEGELRFETVRVVKEVAPDQDVVDAEFPFVNDGNLPAEIISVISNCSCLLAEAPEGPIKPGDKGVVHGKFKVGSFSGTVEKQLQARIVQAGKARNVPLTVAIVVPDVVKITPTTLAWTVGGDPVEQTFKVKVEWKEPINLLKVECSRPEFEFRVETIEAGREYAVHVKPLQIDQPLLGLFQFKTDCKFEKFRNPMGFVHIRRP